MRWFTNRLFAPVPAPVPAGVTVGLEDGRPLVLVGSCGDGYVYATVDGRDSGSVQTFGEAVAFADWAVLAAREGLR